jgi:hypothetical protein
MQILIDQIIFIGNYIDHSNVSNYFDADETS